MVEGGEYPFFTCDEKQFKIDEYAFDEEAILVSGNGSQVGHVNYYKGKFNAYQRTYVLYGFTENVNIRYILYYSKSYLRGYIFKFSKKGSVPYITLPILQNFSIPIPPLEIQNEIVQTLDLFTTLEAELEAELEARKTQCTYYRDSLLSLEGNDVEWKTLGEIYEFKYGTGNTIPTVGGAFPVYGSNGIVGTHNEYNSEDAPVIGHIGAYAGIVNWAPGKHFVTYNGVICRLKDSTVHPRYAYHQLLVQDFRSKANSGSQPFVSYSMLNKVEVPLPSFKEQEIIADVLDKFDALVNDISIGLPAEIEGRRKQYEYYRNRLLTFKELGNG
jgi:type I restriction enzyme S subunit